MSIYIRIRNWVLALAIVASAGGALMTTAVPQVAYAADCNSGFLGFPAWYRGLTDGACNVKNPSSFDKPAHSGNGLSIFIWTIVLNVIEIALVFVAYLAGFYMLYGGFLFIVSEGKPDTAAKARMTMLQAFVGLLISIAAVAVVTFVAGAIV